MELVVDLLVDWLLSVLHAFVFVSFPNNFRSFRLADLAESFSDSLTSSPSTLAYSIGAASVGKILSFDVLMHAFLFRYGTLLAMVKD